MRTLTIYAALWMLLLSPAWGQSTELADSIESEIIYDNCAEVWPDDWRRHQVCTDYQIYTWQDTILVNTRSQLQNWNTFPMNFNGNVKYIVPPAYALAFNLVVTDSNNDTVYNRVAYYSLIPEYWSFSIGFLQYVYTQEIIKLINPLPGQYLATSIITANQFIGHTVAVSFTIDAPVPVELNTFTAKVIGGNVILEWITGTEVNNYGYEIERAVAGKSFDIIGFVPGRGTSNSPNYYNFIDANVISGNYLYRLKQINTDGSYIYSETTFVSIGPPLEFSLEQNYPNPFNPVTTIKYSIPHTDKVELKVYDLLGQEVIILVNADQNTGVHEVQFDASDLPSGIYIYQLGAGTYHHTKKLVLMK